MEHIKPNRREKARSGPPEPGQTQHFFLPVVPMKELAIANFSIILARLNPALKLTSRKSYVEAERVWRRQGRSGFDIIKAVWRESDIPVRAHQEMLALLVHGSTT